MKYQYLGPDTNPRGRRIQYKGQPATIMALVKPMEDIREHLGRDVKVNGGNVEYPLQANLVSEAARYLILTDDGRWYAPRRTSVEKKAPA